MGIKEIRQKSEMELNRFVEESREKLRQLRFDLAAGKVKNVKEIHQVKRDIAKALTMIKEGQKKQN